MKGVGEERRGRGKRRGRDRRKGK